MSDAVLEHIKQLVSFKPRMSTMEVVRYLNSKKYHRNALYRDENKLKLGARRYGKGRNFEFDTFKVVQLKIDITKKATRQSNHL